VTLPVAAPKPVNLASISGHTWSAINTDAAQDEPQTTSQVEVKVKQHVSSSPYQFTETALVKDESKSDEKKAVPDAMKNAPAASIKPKPTVPMDPAILRQ